MAAGAWTVFNQAKVKALDGTFDFDTHTFQIIPLSSAYTPDLAHDGLDDVAAAEVTDGGNSLRQTLANMAVTLVGTAARVTHDDAVVNSNQAVQIKYIAMFDDTAASDPIVAYFDTNTSSADGVTVTQLTVQSPSGVVELK